MRILILSASIPYPPASGGAIRTYGIIKGLYESGYTITLLAFGETNQQKTPLDDLCEKIVLFPTPQHGITKRLRQLVLTNKPDIEVRFYSVEFIDYLKSLLQTESYDWIQIEAIEMGCYMPILKAMNLKARISWDTFNAEAHLQKVIYEIDRRDLKRISVAIYSWLQSKRIYHYEQTLCEIADVVLAVSEEDAMLLRQYQTNTPIYVIPSGIIVADYQSTSVPMNLGKPSLVFTGKMDYRPNVDAMVWFVNAIFPLLPQAQLTIVGQKPTSTIQTLADNHGITITGWVDSVIPYLRSADVYIAPLRMGSGTRLKLLEAMACRCAIVATTIAATGLNETAKQAMVIVDDEIQMAKAIEILFNDSEERERLGNQAYESVRRDYDWSAITPNLIQVYQEVEHG